MEAEYAVGDVVEVWGGGRRSYDGVVDKVGPKLVHVVVHGHITKFIRETQQRRDGYPGHFKTQAQAAEAIQRQSLIEELRQNGIEVQWHIRWDTSDLAKLMDAVSLIRSEE
jgi:hypothetical protein